MRTLTCLVAAAVAAGCQPVAGPPCGAPLPSTILYEGYCADVPGGTCLLDHRTNI